MSTMETTEMTVKTVDMPPIERLEPIHTTGLQRVFALLRVAMGWTFLWAFLDKAFALGFSTGRVVNDAGQTVKIDFFGSKAWIHGASPTVGAIGHALKGPFAGFYQSITGYHVNAAGVGTSAAWIDWVYMLSMLLIGGALILGIGVRLASLGGIVWMAIFYTATAIWPDNNNFLDEHIVFAIVLAGLFLANAGRYYGLGKVWQRTEFIKRHPVLA